MNDLPPPSFPFELMLRIKPGQSQTVALIDEYPDTASEDSIIVYGKKQNKTVELGESSIPWPVKWPIMVPLLRDKLKALGSGDVELYYIVIRGPNGNPSLPSTPTRTTLIVED